MYSSSEMFDKFKQLPEINKIRIDENEFIDDLLEASNITNFILELCASIEPQKKIKKIEQGILTGHMVRIFKLYDSFLLLVSKNIPETSLIVLRILCEAIINLKYFILNMNIKLVEKYLRSSLAYEKEILQKIQKNIKDREHFPIEKRMIESIKKKFSELDFSTEEIEPKEKRSFPPKNIRELAKEVGLENEYDLVYRTCSGAIHGSWHYIKFWHLDEGEDYFLPELGRINTPPQIVEAASILSLSVAKDYLNQISDENLNLVIDKLILWYQNMSIKHEEFIIQSQR